MEVHRIRCVPRESVPIQCLSFHKESNKLALCRSDGNLEVWASRGGSFVKRLWIPGRSSISIQSLKWCGNRLFTGSLAGFLEEWDLKTLSPKQSICCVNGPVWCIAVSANEDYIAAGCESGEVYVYDVRLNEILEVFHFKCCDVRIISIAWHPRDSHLITGGACGIIRKIDLVSESFVLDFKFEDSSDLIIWSLLYQESFIVSADSRGNVVFWNDVFGTILKVFNSHCGDVLALAFYSDLNVIFSAGVDQKIVCYKNLCASNSWVKDKELMIHSNDIYALDVSSDGLLASGGVDSYLAITNAQTIYTAKYFQSQDSASFFSYASKANVLLHQKNDSVQLWRVFPKNQNSLPVNCLTISVNNAYYILSCSISSDATKLAISTVKDFRLYEVNISNSSVHRLLFLKIPSFKQTFCKSKVLLATIKEGLKVFCIATSKWKHYKELCPCAIDFSCNEDGTLIAAKSATDEFAVFDLQHEVKLYSIKNVELTPILKFWSPLSLRMYLPDDGKIYSYDLSTSILYDCGKITKARILPKGMCPVNESVSLIYCEEYLRFIPSGLVTDMSSVQNFKFEDPILFVSKMSKNEIIVVEDVSSNNLPSVVVKEKYGT